MLGNHDLETKPDRDECVITDELIQLQNDVTNRLQKVDLCNVQIIDSTMFVMFTSSIFDTKFDTILQKEESQSIEKNIKDHAKAMKKKKIIEICSNLIPDLKDKSLLNLENIRDFVYQMIVNKVTVELKKFENPISNLVFVCHDPLVCYKYKSVEDEETDEKKDKTQKDKEGKKVKAEKKDTEADPKVKQVLVIPFGGDNYMRLLLKIKEIVNPTKIFYLCADLHQYQEGKIYITEKGKEIIIHQSISGTGGAKLDDEIPEIEKERINSKEDNVDGYTNYKVKYYMFESKKKYGFTEATISPKGIIFDFIEVKKESLPTMGGGRKILKAKNNKTKRNKINVLKMTVKKH